MIISLNDFPNGMRDMMGMGMSRCINTNQATQALADPGQLSAMQREFYEQNIQEQVYMTEYVEVHAQEATNEPDTVYPITCQENLPHASDRMKMYIVAHPMVAHRKEMGANILPGIDLGDEGKLVGRGNPAYDSVMTGVFVNGEEHEEVIHSSQVDKAYPILDEDEQRFVLETWELIDKLSECEDDELEEVFEGFEYH